MFPVLVVTTPAASSERGALRIAFAAPRSLKEPIGWRLSSLSQISPGASSRCRRTSGVRSTVLAIRARARAISS
jgi:hypothetical protein